MSNDPQLPEINARYLVERTLGDQPQGRFLVAIDRELGGRVTVFTPRHRYPSPQDFVLSAKAEVERCQPLRDTAYCTLRDTGIDAEGRPFVIVDRPLGTPLGALLRAHDRLGIDRSLSIAVQLCDLVARAHQQGLHPVPLGLDSIIVHPQPGGRQRVALVDLGLGRGPLRDLAPEPGNPLLESPQVRARQEGQPADDVFAVTAALHVMIFGVAPSPMSIHGPADGSGWPTLPTETRGLDRRLEACLHTVLLKGLAPDRLERFARIDALQRALVGLRQLMSISAPAFELLAATRGRLGRGADPLELPSSRAGLERAAAARDRIQQVMSSTYGERASLHSLDAERARRARRAAEQR